MRVSVALLLLVLPGAAAVAQSEPGGPPRGDRQLDRQPDRQLERQQLRGELRVAARPHRPGESHAAAMPAPDQAKPAPPRHLSPSERAELRQQLRQEQLDSRKVRP